MKKVLAIVLALVMALSCSAMAFAGEDASTTAAATTAAATTKAAAAGDTIINEAAPQNAKCGLCGSILAADEKIAGHTCPTEAATEKDYIDLTVKDVLNAIVELAKAGMTQWADVENVVIKIVEFLDGLVKGTTSGKVDGLVAELEGILAGVEIPGMKDLINALKEKILSWYTPDIFVTEPTETPETGSAPVGIAVFAAVSVAAAAAFVCTKKN
jgi:hypothetical protein